MRQVDMNQLFFKSAGRWNYTHELEVIFSNSKCHVWSGESGLGQDGELLIYQKTEGDFKFAIKLVDSNLGTGTATFRIAINSRSRRN